MACGLVLLGLAAITHAYTTFDTTCTVPSVPSNFVSSPDSRGTLDILWSCLFTIIACTWTVQHLNVPEQREGSDPGFWGDIKWMLKRAWTGTKWMLATILAPELLLAKAWGDLGDAKYDLDKLKDLASEDGVPWTLTHCLFANMGGFVIRGYSDRPEAKKTQATDLPPAVLQSDVIPQPRVSGPTEPEVTSVPCSNSKTENTNMKNGTPEEEGNILVPGHKNLFHLTAPDIIELRTVKLLSKLPYVTIDEINDKSKSDAFVRTISIVQIIWVVILILTRVLRHLAVSQLEIGVLAFSACAVIIYILNWEKPKGVQIPITIACYSGEIPNNILEKLKTLKEPEHTSTGNIAGNVRRFKNPASILGSRNPSSALGSPIPNYYTRNQRGGEMYGLILGSLVFGGIHVAAWKFEFPSRIEQIMWQAASLLCTAISIVCILWACLMFGTGLLIVPISACMGLISGESTFLLAAMVFVFSGVGMGFPLVLYVLARLFLLVEIFRTLCFLPPDAYTSTWASSIPHVS